MIGIRLRRGYGMVRASQEKDMARVADIWLDSNLKAHGFIDGQYWLSHFQSVKEMLSQAEVYIYEDENGVQGFVGLDDDYIAGIFVCDEARSSGIGKQLLDFVKAMKKQLRLHVYQKNTRAVEFYQREGFRLQSESSDEDAGEKEYCMIWSRQHRSSPLR